MNVFYLYFSLLLLGELLVDEVDLVDILGDPVIAEETVVAADNTCEVLELKVLGVQTELGEETHADVGPAPDGPHSFLHIIDAEHGAAGIPLVYDLVVGSIVVVVIVQPIQRRSNTGPISQRVSPTGDCAKVVGIELERIGPVRVLQIIQHPLRVWTYFVCVEVHDVGKNNNHCVLSRL